MPSTWLTGSLFACRHGRGKVHGPGWLPLAVLVCLLACVGAMSPRRIAELRSESRALFYHGYDNYMAYAFPEDELRPLTCRPLTRSTDPTDTGVNDVLGNYSLTLIDSLSTLAILASTPPEEKDSGFKALKDFQEGVEALVIQYGDGTEGTAGQGLRGRGFDLDSKVQVFETVIRGVGGLLSAHLFAVGDLPISGYDPKSGSPHTWKDQRGETHRLWPNHFEYNGQLLRLALDLAQRLLPAFYSNTGLPYPRVNLRHGVPFYENSPMHETVEESEFINQFSKERTDTCSAGAGSLVLEFTVLSRLTGDDRFEQLGKRAFWAVWSRRSSIGLLADAVDTEAGTWQGGYSGIGAGIDSFFEYAFKTYVLLSGRELPDKNRTPVNRTTSWIDPNVLYPPLTDAENSADSFLEAWQEAHAAIKRHVYSDLHHPHYMLVHRSTGSVQAYWVDSLGAYYPGLLAIAGEVEEAIAANLLYAALWTRYSALPERWSVYTKEIEGGLGWWPGRPEFIESNYHIYRATRDPWYLYVGEMVIEDITRRCWTDCGWSGLQDVKTGEKSDRMESFFLGETAKYLYLLFDPDHPLNNLDAPFVFTTEGHPLIIPKTTSPRFYVPSSNTSINQHSHARTADTCPAPPSLLPLTMSVTAARPDMFHAGSMVGLHHYQNVHQADGVVAEESNGSSRIGTSGSSNYTFFPWTLPLELVPINGFCAAIPEEISYRMKFPTIDNVQPPPGPMNVIFRGHGLERVEQGILMTSTSGIEISMIQENEEIFLADVGYIATKSWRINMIGSTLLGRDEKVFVDREVLGAINDPSFNRIKSLSMVDLTLQFRVPGTKNHSGMSAQSTRQDGIFAGNLESLLANRIFHDSEEEEIISARAIVTEQFKTIFTSLLHRATSALQNPVATIVPQPEQKPTFRYMILPGSAPTGVGAAPIPDIKEAPNPNMTPIDDDRPLSWTSVYFAGEACTSKLPDEAVRSHQVIVMLRGGCSFSEKLANIPSFAPSKKGFQFVIVVSDDSDQKGDDLGTGQLIRPMLDEEQRTPSGLLRRHQISMVLVGGGDETYRILKKVTSLGLRRRYHIESLGLIINNMIVI